MLYEKRMKVKTDYVIKNPLRYFYQFTLIDKFMILVSALKYVLKSM
ncbi:hypothetical protein GCM10023260_09930 [Bartonella acomydis]|uniref:Uncharacterized protein n=1 Tax=Bartonella acomydis TaxID=686234 RepID=A0ABP9MPF2_9HYPH